MDNGKTNGKFHEYTGGALRESKTPFYREIPSSLLRRLAEALQHGAEKYSEGPLDSNWKKGDLTFAVGCFDHLIEHLYAWREGKTDEDHLGHAAANLAFLTWFQEEQIWDPAGAIKAEGLNTLDALRSGSAGNQGYQLEEAEATPAPSAPSKLWDIIRRKGAVS